MKKIIATLFLSVLVISVTADKYYTKTGKISFYSTATLEKIEAHNGAVGVLLNSSTGDLNFSVLIKSFVFKKKLMQEHFNENYLESDKYPKAKFAGKIANMSKVNLKKDGKYLVTVNGNLSIHGQTKKVSQKGYIYVKNGIPKLSATFSVLLSDYQIKIPRAVKDKISKTVKISISASLKKL